jgi:hypothetical protein
MRTDNFGSACVVESLRRDPDGLLLSNVLHRVTAILDKLPDSRLAALDAKLFLIGKLAASGMEGSGDVRELHRIACELRSDAIAFGLKDMSRAANSLCVLAGSNRTEQPLWEGVGIHVHALAALRRPQPGSDVATQEILIGLEQISHASVG